MNASGGRKWVCLVCGYVHEGEGPPDECPICAAGPEEFEEDLQRTRAALEVPGGNAVLGFRSSRWLRKDDLWIL